MGTFHDDLGPLHGITIVVDTTGPRVLVGRCHEITDEAVFLVGAAVHEERQGERTKDEYVRHAAKFGYWEQHPKLAIPRSDVTSIRRLGEC